MIYGSVCSGIEAATVAWEPLGWKPAFYSEIEKNARKVLTHHYPNVPLHGDFTTIGADDYGRIDLLAGGTPCQSYSVAGKRAGLDDPRGELSLEFVRLAERKHARWVIWENVPGVLSTNGGRDFAAFVGALAECGYGWAYRVLDAQFFGVPQKRQRVILVGYRGDGRLARAALCEPNGGDWVTPKRRKAGEEIIGALTTRSCVSRCNYGAEVGHCVVDNKTRLPRWLSARECELAMGFPVGYTDVDGVTYWKRHAMLGNSWAVPVFRWLGERIYFLEKTCCVPVRLMR